MSYIWDEWELKPQCGDDAIKRADVCRLLLDYLREYNERFANDTQKVLTTIDNIDDLRWFVERMPPMLRAVNVKPVVQGKWIRRQSWSEGFGMGESYGFYWECSICGRQTKGDYDECGRNFCHNCGAKNE